MHGKGIIHSVAQHVGDHIRKARTTLASNAILVLQWDSIRRETLCVAMVPFLDYVNTR